METRGNPIVIWRGMRSGDKQSSTGDCQAQRRRRPFTDSARAVGSSVSEVLWVTLRSRNKRNALAVPEHSPTLGTTGPRGEKKGLCSGPSEQDQLTSRSRWKRPKQEVRGGQLEEGGYQLRPGQPDRQGLPSSGGYGSPRAHLTGAALVVAKLGLSRAWPLS